jgi:hypothetical protein
MQNSRGCAKKSVMTLPAPQTEKGPTDRNSIRTVGRTSEICSQRPPLPVFPLKTYVRPAETRRSQPRSRRITLGTSENQSHVKDLPLKQTARNIVCQLIAIASLEKASLHQSSRLAVGSGPCSRRQEGAFATSATSHHRLPSPRPASHNN